MLASVVTKLCSPALKALKVRFTDGMSREASRSEISSMRLAIISVNYLEDLSIEMVSLTWLPRMGNSQRLRCDLPWCCPMLIGSLQGAPRLELHVVWNALFSLKS